MIAILIALTFMQTAEAPQPFVADLDTVAVIHNVEVDVSRPRAAAWSPVSDTLAFIDDGIYLAWPSSDWVPTKIKNDVPGELKWSPDGKKLAYFVNQDSRDEISMVVVIDVPSGRTLLVIDATGRWDLCWRNSNDICLRDKDGGKWRRFRVAQDSTVVPATPHVWMTSSTTGRVLVPPIRVGDPVGVNIKSFQIPGLDPTGLSNVFAYDVCKDGESVLVHAPIDSVRKKVVLRTDGTMIDLGTSIHSGEFSPDCRYVVGTESKDDGHVLLESDLWVIELSTLRRLKLTDSPAFEHEPTFSHDGNYLAYQMEKNDALFLVVTKIAFGE